MILSALPTTLKQQSKYNEVCYYKNANNKIRIEFVQKTNTGIMPPYIGTVVGDPDDPLQKEGLDFEIHYSENIIPTDEVILSVESSNEAIIASKEVVLSKSKTTVNIKPKVIAAGQTTLTIKAKWSKQEQSVDLYIAASEHRQAGINTIWHTGICDASAAIKINDSLYIIADDEKNVLCLYNRTKPGLPLQSFDYSNMLKLKDCKGKDCSETDVEAGVQSLKEAKKIYWLGSLSNGKYPKCKLKPNRNRVFSTTITQSNNETKMSVDKWYSKLREDISRWGNAYGYAFSKSIAEGTDPKTKEGFSLEGAAFAPDSTTLYIGMRAPLVPPGKRNNAVIIPIQNFENWFNNTQNTPPAFAAPIELNLSNRGIRDITRLSNGTYIIAAGNCESSINSALYKWNGLPESQPVLLQEINTAGLNVEGIIEVKQDNAPGKIYLQMVCDNGNEIYYNDGIKAKDIGQREYKKFRSVIVACSVSCLKNIE